MSIQTSTAPATLGKIENFPDSHVDVEKTRREICSLPHTSVERLQQAAEELEQEKAGNATIAETVLYLAYGSNLSAETFRGMRGIMPLSAVNVSAPTLRLTFSLPGIPYREPCFANVDYRKLPEKPKLPDPTNPPAIPPFDPPVPGQAYKNNDGLIGVVYEVTKEDFRTIISTEGGGASYKEIAIPCIALEPPVSVPEKPPFPKLPKAFLARTLFAPHIPPGTFPGHPEKKRWWYRLFFGPYRPDPEYAQPSLRYLNLLRAGAKEHELPEEYQTWLQELQPYTATTRGQRIGMFLYSTFWTPFIMTIFMASKMFSDKTGRVPKWLAVPMTMTFNLAWLSYDYVFKPLFGDGERTYEQRSEEIKSSRRRRGKDEEAEPMLSDRS